MKPKRIILVRHGESAGNVDRGVYERIPDYKIPLTQRGREQAYACGLELKAITGNESCFFYVSPLWRTRETFAQIQRNYDGVPQQVREEPRIREQEWGHLKNLAECMRIDQERDHYGTFYYRIPDGESAADVYDRVSDFFGTLHRDFEKPDFPENCVIVTHGMTIRLFLMKWFHWSVEYFEMLRNPKNCAVFVLERNEAGKYMLLTEPEKHN